MSETQKEVVNGFSTTETQEEDVNCFSFLPREIMYTIVQYLDGDDLIACCGVCKQWRNALNVDKFWRDLCMANHWMKPEFPFKSHLFVGGEIGTEFGDLDELCTWRKWYNTQYRLDSNWKHSKGVRYKLSENKLPVYSLDCDGSTLVVGHDRGMLSVWNVDSIPYKVQDVECALKRPPVTSVKSFTDYIACIQSGLLQVYKKQNYVYVLHDAESFCLNESHLDLLQKIKHMKDSFDWWYIGILRFREELMEPVRFHYLIHNGILYLSYPRSPLIQLRDMNTFKNPPMIQLKRGLLVNEMKVCDGSIYVICFDYNTTVFRISTEENGDSLTEIVSVDGFSDVSIDLKYIIAIPRPGYIRLSHLQVWYRKTSQLVGTRLITSAYVPSAITQGDNIVYSENREVFVWNPIEDVVVLRVVVETYVSFMKPGFNKYVILFLNSTMSVMDTTTGRILYRMYSSLDWTADYRNLLWTCPTLIIAGAIRDTPEIIVMA